jgi:hypothetical protein
VPWDDENILVRVDHFPPRVFFRVRLDAPRPGVLPRGFAASQTVMSTTGSIGRSLEMTAIAFRRNNFRTFRIARITLNKANIGRLDRTRDALDALFAKIVEAVWQLATDLVAYGMRHAYATNRRQCLKSIRNVHFISLNVVWLDKNFGDIDADPENEAGRMRHPGVPQRHALLDVDGHWTASIALANSMSMPSPTVLTMRPRRAAS